MKTKKQALFHSIVSLILCISMFVGTTFAWFTDTVTSGNNIIASGTLDVELYHSNATVTDERVDSATQLFMDLNGRPILWEPGVVSYENLRITNEGNLALAYQMSMNTANENYILDPSGEQYGLSQILKVGVVEGGITATDRASVIESVEDGNWTTLADFVRNSSLLPEGEGESEKTWGVVIYWEPGDNDNRWNLNNGKQLSEGEFLMIELGIKLVATQEVYESDSFGNDYDTEAKKAVFPEFAGGTATKPVIPNDQGLTDADVTMQAGQISATVPAGVKLADGTTELKLTVSQMGESGANVTLGEDEQMRSLDVHIEGVAADNTTPITVTLKKAAPTGLNMGNYKIYHVEATGTTEMTLVASDADFTAHNQFKYDPATGDLVLYMATFSEVAMVADTENAWNGEFDYEWYEGMSSPYTIANADQLAAFGAIVGGMNGQTQNSFAGKTVKLIADINLGDKESENDPDLIFYPIGYYNNTNSYEKTSGGSVTSSVSSFKGTFDGQGHTIANFYQNTWEMFGDYNDGYSGTPNHYKDAMGLFGYVLNGTVKNLTVSNFSSDGEYTPTGVIAAYADGNSNFENIAITNCNPRVYNTGNGGIIGIAGDTSAANDDHITLKNITVDNSNKISALWGSWDVACGGLVGMYRGNVDGNGAATGDTISFENCHVSAIIDVYNDVCANYQYYAYRYSGMIIGSVRHNTTNTEGKTIPNMTGISATGCTVNYGDWNDYYYCEFEKNSMASYSEDYQFSRVPHSELNFTDSNGNNVVDADERVSVTGCKHTHTAEENHQAIYLPFHQLFTGYSWGVSSIGLKEYSGIVTNLDITEGDQEKSVEKFETKFTGDFLYRVGNANSVSLGSLFAAAAKKDADGNELKDENGETIYWDIQDSGVVVTVDKVDKNSNVGGTFTKATDGKNWTEGTIKFDGTGVVKVTIQDYNFCTPTEMLLEVVDAVNATSATSATKNNVVLLNDITNASFTVSNGYTFYGNGFTIKLPTNSVQEKGQGFTGYVSIGAAQDSGAATGGNLDNVRIEGPVYPEMYLYRSQAEISDKNDPDYGNGSNMRYFRNSVIVYGGNCTISNSYISGCRTPVCLRGGNNVVIDNTTLSGGSVANMQVAGVNSLVLRDLTTEGTLGIYVDSSAASVTVEGELKQYNWTTKSKWEEAIGGGANAKFFPDFFSASNSSYAKYQHQRDGQTYVNMAFVFACDWDSANKWNNDHQTNKNIYSITDKIEITTPNASVSGGVYTIAGQTLTDELYSAPAYKASGYNPVAPSLTFDNTPNSDSDDANDANDTYCVYNEASGTLKIGVSGDSKTIDLSKVTVSKNGANLDYTAYLNGSQINGDSVTIKAADGAKQTLTFKATSKDAGYDKNGNPITGSIEYTWTVTVEIAVLSYPAPVWNMDGDYQFDKNNCLYAYYGTSNGYGEAVAIYEGIKVNYYNKSGTLVKLDLSETTTHPTGSNNSNSNAFTYTLSDGATLTMKFSSGWKSGATTHQFTTYNNKVYIYPQSLDNDNYIRAKVTNQDFDVKISYTFTDPNGQSVSQTMQWYNAKDSNSSVTTVQWKDFDSVNGKKASVCVTPDTFVTLADGTQKRIDQTTYNDQFLVWDFIKGEYTVAPASIVMNHGYDNYTVVTLNFTDGTTVKTINGHGFYHVSTDKFVIVNANNVEDYVGDSFVQSDGKTVKLNSFSIHEEYTESWSILTAGHYNCVLEGMLTLTPAEVEGSPDYLMPYTVGEGMKYDEAKMTADIEKYGLYSYEDFTGLCTYEQFVGFGFANWKVAVGKGYITWDEILYLLNIHVNN